MPLPVLAMNVHGVKLGSGNIRLEFTRPNGTIAFMAVIPTADFATLHTSVNSGSTGTFADFSYKQDLNASDYPHGYVAGVII